MCDVDTLFERMRFRTNTSMQSLTVPHDAYFCHSLMKPNSCMCELVL